MWNRPQLMAAVSDLLFAAAAAALLVAALVGVARLPLFPVHEIQVTNALREVRRAELEEVLAGRLRGNFFSINLEGIRQAVEQLPWVRSAEARRQWPSKIELAIEEHAPVAYWGDATGQLVNSHGEVFTATMTAPPPSPIPMLFGPNELTLDMLGYYQQAAELTKPLGRVPQTLTISPRLAVQLKLDDGMVVELGREQPKAPVRERLLRFVEFYPNVLNAVHQRPTVVDMRYPNGFALHVAAAPVTENKGKP